MGSSVSACAPPSKVAMGPSQHVAFLPRAAFMPFNLQAFLQMAVQEYPYWWVQAPRGPLGQQLARDKSAFEGGTYHAPRPTLSPPSAAQVSSVTGGGGRGGHLGAQGGPGDPGRQPVRAQEAPAHPHRAWPCVLEEQRVGKPDVCFLEQLCCRQSAVIYNHP